MKPSSSRAAYWSIFADREHVYGRDGLWAGPSAGWSRRVLPPEYLRFDWPTAAVSALLIGWTQRRASRGRGKGPGLTSAALVCVDYPSR